MSQLSEKCRVRLKEPPDCFDPRGVRSWVICKAWERVLKERVPFRDAMRLSWEEVKKTCRKS